MCSASGRETWREPISLSARVRVKLDQSARRRTVEAAAENARTRRKEKEGKKGERKREKE